LNRERPVRGLLFARRRGGAERSGRASAIPSPAAPAAPSIERSGLSAGRDASWSPREPHIRSG
jgi:hypothetical protein